MRDYCIENDLVAQREMAEIAIDGLHENYRRLRGRFNTLEEEFEEYKNAMEWEMGNDWVDKILKQYRLNTNP